MTVLQDVRCRRCGAEGTRALPPAGPLGDRVRSWPWVCEQCAALEEVEDAQQRDRERRQAEQQRQLERQERRQQLSSVPVAHRRDLRELDLDPGNRDAIRAAVAWRDGELRGLVLTGPVGAGKSTIAGAACWEAQLRHQTPGQPLEPMWASVPIVLAKMLASFTNSDRAQALKAITGDGPIVLDDLDKLNATPWAATQLFAAIEGRVIAGQQLLVTTNLTLDELDAHLGGEYGTAVASRLVGYCRVLRVDGPDRRMPR